MAVLPIGFFAPLPLAIMIPFMAAQSFAMGHAFGTSFQYGKRKISSMSNEEFNALSATDLHGVLQADIRGMIPSMNQSFQRMEDFQIDIIKSMANVILKAGEQFLGLLTGGGSSTTQSSTSAIDFSETGVFNVQGGSRTDINQGNDRFLNDLGQTYDEWITANKVNDTITAKQEASAKIAAANLSRAIKEAPKFVNLVRPSSTVQKIAPSLTDIKQTAGTVTQLSSAKKVYNARKKNYEDKLNILNRFHIAQVSFLKSMTLILRRQSKGSIAYSKMVGKINLQVVKVKKSLADLNMHKRLGGNFRLPYYK